MGGRRAERRLMCRCVAYEMAARRPAFNGGSLPQLLVRIMRNDFEPLPSHFSRPFQQLVSTILRADPADRPTAARLMMLPIVKTHLAALASNMQPAPRPATAGSNMRMCQSVARPGTSGANADILCTAAETQGGDQAAPDTLSASEGCEAGVLARNDTGQTVPSTPSSHAKRNKVQHSATVKPPKPTIKVHHTPPG